jgi:hypothetical protein
LADNDATLRTITPETLAVAKELAQVGEFAVGGVGIAGTTSRGEALTLQLSQRPDAEAAFAWLAGSGEPAARLYAYWALLTLAPEVAGRIGALLEQDHAQVTFGAGCIMSHRRVDELVARIRDPKGIRAMRTQPRPA